MTRDDRQGQAVDTYRRTAIGTGILRGTLNHCTGFGKTKEAKTIVDKLIAKQGPISFIVVVPTTDLQDQWTGLLTEHINYKVSTIQGIVSRNQVEKCDFLILDEIHKMAAEQFIRVFDLIEYTHILGLTATYNRMDGKHILIDRHCPVIDTITLEEARKNGWVADFIEYNWGIRLDSETQVEYERINDEISRLFAYFDHDFQSLIGCSTIKGAKYYLLRHSTTPPTEEEIKSVSTKANICRQYIDQRLEILNSAPCKIEATIEAINYLKMKTVTFWTSTTVTDILASRIPNSSAYHSGVKPRSKLIKLLDYFIEGKVKIIHTAKKADLGLDVPNLRCGIVGAGTKDPGTHDQRKGRFVRKEGDKEAIILNIYIKDTKDEYNVKARQKNSRGVRWINSLTEIKI